MGSESWLKIAADSPFSLRNIPFGVISTPKHSKPHIAIAIGDHVLDLTVFAASGGFLELPAVNSFNIGVFGQPDLNAFAALGRQFHRQVREYLQDIFGVKTSFPWILKDAVALQKEALLSRFEVQCLLPMKIAGYTDFFAGKNHAYNCGCIFRDPKNALQPNYLHLPVGYSSRASSVVVSGTAIRRPLGQFLESPDMKAPTLGPCRKLDIEVELGALLCKGNEMGSPISVHEAEEYIFGFVLLNDWSARDIQAWEAVPLGPFNAKNFASTISPWVVLTDALTSFRCPGIPNETELLPHLRQRGKDNFYDIQLEVALTPEGSRPVTFSRVNANNLVFSFAQMLAHHTIGGCPMEVGDLLGSGTISGTENGTLGSLLEATNGGKKDSEISETISRRFLNNGDTVTIRGWSGEGGQGLVGFGECTGKILPSLKIDYD